MLFLLIICGDVWLIESLSLLQSNFFFYILLKLLWRAMLYDLFLSGLLNYFLVEKSEFCTPKC